MVAAIVMEMIIIIIITMKICKEQKMLKWRWLELVLGENMKQVNIMAIENCHFILWKMDLGEKKSGFHLHFEALAIAFLRGQKQG